MKQSTIILLLFLLTGQVSAAESIVGTWSSSREFCSGGMGALQIGPKSLSLWEDTECEFDVVRRKGDQITWVGRCIFFGDGEAQSITKPSTVIANLRKDRRLTIKIIGHAQPLVVGYSRCTD